MREYFKTSNWVITKTLKKSMEKKIIYCICDNIYKESEKQNMDYLQVFSFVFCEKTKILTIIHKQEETKFTKAFKIEYIIKNIDYKSIVNLLNKKVYCIDDKSHQTMLFADEY